jgi:hypothetical protein
VRLILQREAESLDRVLDYMAVNAVALGPILRSKPAAEVRDAVDQIRALHNVQGTANLVMDGQLARARALADALRGHHMNPIADFARVRCRAVPDMAALTSSNHRLRGRALAAAGHALAEAAVPHLDVLIRGCFPPDVIDQLSAAAQALDQAITDYATTRAARIGATAGIRDTVRKGRGAARALDSVVTKRLSGNEALLASWRAAFRVTRS